MKEDLVRISLKDKKLRKSSKVRAWEKNVNAIVNAYMKTPEMQEQIKKAEEDLIIQGWSSIYVDETYGRSE